MSTATVISLHEYLTTSYRPDREYLDGELLERNVGEWDHSRLQMLLSRYLSNREKEWGILVVPEQRVQVKATRVRVLDISVLAGIAPTGAILVEPPLLCIEIRLTTIGWRRCRSGSTTISGLGYGCWVIHPRTRCAFVYTPEGMQEVKDGVLQTDGPNIRVPLNELE